MTDEGFHEMEGLVGREILKSFLCTIKFYDNLVLLLSMVISFYCISDINVRFVNHGALMRIDTYERI